MNKLIDNINVTFNDMKRVDGDWNINIILEPESSIETMPNYSTQTNYKATFGVTMTGYCHEDEVNELVHLFRNKIQYDLFSGITMTLMELDKALFDRDYGGVKNARDSLYRWLNGSDV